MKRKVIGVLFIMLAFVGCESEPMKFENPTRLSDKVQYFKDKHGNCFALLGIRRTAVASMNGVGLAHVPKKNCPIK